MKVRIIKILFLLVMSISCLVSAASGDYRTYNLDSTRSSLTVSATVIIFPLTEQFSGSLLSRISGQIVADVRPTTIQFLTGYLVPSNNRFFLPGVNATGPAALGNYGGNLDLGPYGPGKAAFRELYFVLTSPAISRTRGAISYFAANVITMATHRGAIDLDISLFGAGREPFAPRQSFNEAATLGSLTQVGCIETITVPISAAYTLLLDSTVRFTGQVVGYRNICGRRPPP